MKKISVEQTFESIGDPSRREFESEADAELYANKLREGIADIVSVWETPDRHTENYYGNREESAWSEALDAIGFAFDNDGDRTSDSPTHYGLTGGLIIAEAAVEIEDEDEDLEEHFGASIED